MCGIAGMVGTLADLNVVKKMTHTLIARGPDDYRVVKVDDHCVLGHTRLSIMDLSDAGRQPMHDSRTNVWSVVNGEIYNYLDLRKEIETRGISLTSSCDSEVVVKGYALWGDQIISKLIGIFAVAIYDSGMNKLVIARDCAGVKPLYYLSANNNFAFASELKALRKCSRFQLEFDPNCIWNYLAYRYIPGTNTPYKNASKLAPGNFLVWESGRISTHQYWKPFYNGSQSNEKKEITDLSNTLKLCVEEQLMSDVPVGVLLSGGIDSSAVAAIASQRTNIQAFCCGFEEPAFDERKFARLSARTIGIPLHETVMTWQGLCNMLPNYIDWFDEPFFNYSAVAIYELSRLARKYGIKVLLAGEGADEMFAGYLWYDDFSTFESGDCETALDRFFSYKGFFTRKMLNRLSGRKIEYDHLWLLKRHDRPDLPPVSRAQWIDFHTFLPDDVLCRDDRASMAAGVEIRVPFLDNRMLDSCFMLPQQLLYKYGERKYALKRALLNFLPKSLLTKRKKGFGFPLEAWDKPIRALTRNLLANGQMVTHGYVSKTGLEDALRHMNAHALWLMLTAELWMRRFVAREDIRQLVCRPYND